MPRDDARASSPGLRRKTAERHTSPAKGSAPGHKPSLQSGGRHRRGTNIVRECWLTGRRGWKYFVQHHVMTVEEDPDLTVWLCRGSHYLVNLLSRYKIIDDPSKMADLIMLARTQAGKENKRIVVRYEDVE